MKGNVSYPMYKVEMPLRNENKYSEDEANNQR